MTYIERVLSVAKAYDHDTMGVSVKDLDEEFNEMSREIDKLRERKENNEGFHERMRLVKENRRLREALTENESSAERGSDLEDCSYCEAVLRRSRNALKETT